MRCCWLPWCCCCGTPVSCGAALLPGLRSGCCCCVKDRVSWCGVCGAAGAAAVTRRKIRGSGGTRKPKRKLSPGAEAREDPALFHTQSPGRVGRLSAFPSSSGCIAICPCVLQFCTRYSSSRSTHLLLREKKKKKNSNATNVNSACKFSHKFFLLCGDT